MGYETDYVVKKRNGWVSAIKVILILAAVAFAAYTIYRKFFAKKAAVELEAEDDLDGLEESVTEGEEIAALEADAEDVIANPECMD